MRFLMFCLVTAVIAGGLYYHTEISAYVANIADSSSGSDGGSSVTGSMRNLGDAASGAMGNVGDALNR